MVAVDVLHPRLQRRVEGVEDAIELGRLRVGDGELRPQLRRAPPLRLGLGRGFRRLRIDLVALRLGRRGLAVEDGEEASERVVGRDLPGPGRGRAGRRRESARRIGASSETSISRGYVGRSGRLPRSRQPIGELHDATDDGVGRRRAGCQPDADGAAGSQTRFRSRMTALPRSPAVADGLPGRQTPASAMVGRHPPAPARGCRCCCWVAADHHHQSTGRDQRRRRVLPLLRRRADRVRRGSTAPDPRRRSEHRLSDDDADLERLAHQHRRWLARPRPSDRDRTKPGETA